MLYIHPVGGLGNMFFHIAAIWTLAKDNNDDLCLLNIDKKIYDLDNDTRWNSKHAIKYKYIFNRFLNFDIKINNNIEYPYNYKQLEYKKEYQYIGYFQSEKYFKHRRNEILELFKPATEFNVDINKYSNLFGNICLHVRRNDYVKLYPEIHIPQPIDYYNNALTLLPSDMKVLIFSDDLEWCKKNFIGNRFIFIDEVDYISIYVMSKMKHHIIANSSFSWWSAWMSEYDNKIIIAPKKWFGENSYSDVDLIPDNWIRV